MEWDEFQLLELFQSFESASVSSILDLRQKQWKESTEKTIELKEMIERLRVDISRGINHLKTEREELIQKLKQKKNIIQGKEIEILGLRHQLRSMLVCKPTCNSCSQEIIAPKIKNMDAYNEYMNAKDTETHSKNRKRTLINTSITTSLDSVAAADSSPGIIPMAPGEANANLRHRPSQKRRCLSDLNGQLALGVKPPAFKSGILVTETQDDVVDKDDDCQVSLPDTQRSLNASPNLSLSEEDDVTVTSHQSAPTLTFNVEAEMDPADDESRVCPVGMASFSPPTRAFDASFAIRAAVNHADLDDYEKSVFMPSHRTEVTDNSLKSIDLFKKTKKAKAEHVLKRRNTLVPVSEKSRHRKTCRYFQKTTPPSKDPSIATTEESDVTGVDVTDLPSDMVVSFDDVTATSADILTNIHAFSDTEASAPRDRRTKKLVVEKEVEKGRPDIDVDLPSIGGSPTNKIPKPVFKKPQVRNTSCALGGLNSSALVDKEAETQAPINTLALKKSPPSNVVRGNVTEKTHLFLKHVSLIASKKTNDVQKRQNLPAYTCPSCEKYYKAAGYSEDEILKRLQDSSKHRHIDAENGVAPPSTPEGFWTVNMTTNAANYSQNNQAPQSRITRSAEKRPLRRRRPLEFPSAV